MGDELPRDGDGGWANGTGRDAYRVELVDSNQPIVGDPTGVTVGCFGANLKVPEGKMLKIVTVGAVHFRTIEGILRARAFDHIKATLGVNPFVHGVCGWYNVVDLTNCRYTTFCSDTDGWMRHQLQPHDVLLICPVEYHRAHTPQNAFRAAHPWVINEDALAIAAKEATQQTLNNTFAALALAAKDAAPHTASGPVR